MQPGKDEEVGAQFRAIIQGDNFYQNLDFLFCLRQYKYGMFGQAKCWINTFKNAIHWLDQVFRSMHVS